MRILQHAELLAKLFFTPGQRHRVRPWRSKQGNASRPGSGPPTFRPHSDIRCVEWRGPQFDLPARLESQVPPVAVDAGLRFAGSGVRAALSTSGASGAAWPRGWPRAFGSGWPALDFPHHFAACIADGQASTVLFTEVGLEIEVEYGAERGIVTRRGVIENCGRLRYGPETVSGARREQMSVRRQHFRRQLLQWCKVIQDPETAPVGGQR